MNLHADLPLLIDEYLNENAKRNIQQISISIPGHQGHFFIIDSSSLDLRITQGFKLSIYFSFDHTNKKGQKMLEKINLTNCLEGFENSIDAKNLVYIKRTDNDS